MDKNLKEAIEAVRTGDTLAAQRQLTALLDKDPQQVQGWYLLSLLVDSPQQQAAYLSKTLALNPNHEKAREQLAALQSAAGFGPNTTVKAGEGSTLDVVAQSETDSLPDWLKDEADDGTILAVPAEQAEPTAVPNESLPDWLKMPASIDTEPQTSDVVHEETDVAGEADPASASDDVVTELKQTLTTTQKASKVSSLPKQSTRTLNLVLGLLVTLALIVMVLLAYLLLS